MACPIELSSPDAGATSPLANLAAAAAAPSAAAPRSPLQPLSSHIDNNPWLPTSQHSVHSTPRPPITSRPTSLAISLLREDDQERSSDKMVGEEAGKGAGKEAGRAGRGAGRGAGRAAKEAAKEAARADKEAAKEAARADKEQERALQAAEKQAIAYSKGTAQSLAFPYKGLQCLCTGAQAAGELLCVLSDSMNRKTAPGRNLVDLYDEGKTRYRYQTNNELGGDTLATLHFVRCLPLDHPHAMQVHAATLHTHLHMHLGAP